MLNTSLILHPPGFYVIAFTTLPSVNLYFIFLAFVYAVTVLSNSLVIYIIAFDHCLHTPKFLAVGNLAVVDLILSTCIIPSMIKTFLAKDSFVLFELCLVQMFVYYAFVSLESFALVILAYDRFIAICFPLRQHAINTVQSMSCLLAAIWVVGVGVNAYAIAIITRLSFCDSVTVFSYFCDYAPVFRLACNDNTPQWVISSVLSMLFLIAPFLFIIMTYVAILVTVLNMKSLDCRLKALSTCVEHFVLVAIFYFPILIIFIIGLFFGRIAADRRVLSLSLASCLPPCLNPIIYSLKTKEIRTRALVLLRRARVSA